MIAMCLLFENGYFTFKQKSNNNNRPCLVSSKAVNSEKSIGD